MKLRLSEIQIVLNGLNKLVEFEENPSNKLLLSGKARYAIYKNIRKSREIMEDVEKTRQKIFLDVIGENRSIQVNSPEGQEFIKKYNEFLGNFESTDFEPITLFDLNLDKNQIPFTILGLLDPLIKE